MPVTSASATIAAAIANALNLGTFGSSAFNASFGKSLAFTGIGAGAGNFNAAYAKDRTVTAGTPDVLNLTDGTLKQPDGVTAAVFADILLIGAWNNSTTAGQNIQLGGGTGDVTTFLGATGIETILPGMGFILGGAVATGYAVTASTADKINVNVAAGTGVSYSILIVGH